MVNFIQGKVLLELLKKWLESIGTEMLRYGVMKIGLEIILSIKKHFYKQHLLTNRSEKIILKHKWLKILLTWLKRDVRRVDTHLILKKNSLKTVIHLRQLKTNFKCFVNKQILIWLKKFILILIWFTQNKFKQFLYIVRFPTF